MDKVIVSQRAGEIQPNPGREDCADDHLPFTANIDHIATK
jgi:hypothetical protein